MFNLLISDCHAAAMGRRRFEYAHSPKTSFVLHTFLCNPMPMQKSCEIRWVLYWWLVDVCGARAYRCKHSRIAISLSLIHSFAFSVFFFADCDFVRQTFSHCTREQAYSTSKGKLLFTAENIILLCISSAVCFGWS